MQRTGGWDAKVSYRALIEYYFIRDLQCNRLPAIIDATSSSRVIKAYKYASDILDSRSAEHEGEQTERLLNNV